MWSSVPPQFQQGLLYEHQWCIIIIILEHTAILHQVVLDNIVISVTDPGPSPEWVYATKTISLEEKKVNLSLILTKLCLKECLFV